MNAEYLRQFDYDNPPMVRLSRTNATEKLYKQFQRSGAHRAFITGIKRKLNTKPYIWIDNLFPYNVKKPIQHSCLWYKGKLSKRKILGILKSDGHRIHYLF